MPRVPKKATKSQSLVAAGGRAHPPQLTIPLNDGTMILTMLQAVLPVAFNAVEDALTQEVPALAGAR